MRTFASLALVILALDLMAFDSADWLGKRELLTREAERLRAAYTNCVARLEAPADDVTVPVETFPDGSVKVVIHAKRAQYFADTGLVWAEGVTVKRFAYIAEIHHPETVGRVTVARASAVIVPDERTLTKFKEPPPAARVSVLADPHAELVNNALTSAEFSSALNGIYNYVIRTHPEIDT